MTTKKKVLVTIGSDQDFKGYAEYVGAEYRALDPTNKVPFVDLFRLKKYQDHYDELVYIGPKRVLLNVDLFKEHVEGSVGRVGLDLLVVDKTSPQIFEHPDADFDVKQAGGVINSRITKAYKIENASDGPGTQFKNLLRKAGVGSCYRCSVTAAEMNLKGPDWCESEFDALVKRILKNAKASESLLVWVSTVATDSVGAAKPAIRWALKKAIETARAVEKDPLAYTLSQSDEDLL